MSTEPVVVHDDDAAGVADTERRLGDLRAQVLEIREQLREQMVAEPTTGTRMTYRDGFGQGLAYAVEKLDSLGGRGGAHVGPLDDTEHRLANPPLPRDVADLVAEPGRPGVYVEGKPLGDYFAPASADPAAGRVFEPLRFPGRVDDVVATSEGTKRISLDPPDRCGGGGHVMGGEGTCVCGEIAMSSRRDGATVHFRIGGPRPDPKGPEGSPVRAYLLRHLDEAEIALGYAEAALENTRIDHETHAGQVAMIREALGNLDALEGDRERLAQLVVHRHGVDYSEGDPHR